jgi:ribosomal protein S18 acetylase RimI-like enzyme
MAIPTALVPVSEIFQLRWEVLRPGLPRETAVFPEDSDPEAFHIAAYDGPGSVAACVTFFPDSLEEVGQPGFRFRGLASAPRVRGLGFGFTVLQAGIEELRKRGVPYVWCNGRVSAVGFYQRQGFRPVGDAFELAPAGRHYRFLKMLDD